MNAIRTVLLVLVCAAAITGTIVLFGSDGAPFEEKDRFLAGTWRGPSPDGEIALELADDGRYALVVGTGGGVVHGVECGKWRYRGDSLQMRSKKHTSIADTLLLRHPGLRAGSVTRRGDDGLALTLLAANKSASHWDLRRATDHLMPLCD